MKDPNRLTDITLVIYPSNYVINNSPKIVLLGKGSEWKDEVVQETNNYWTETPVLFYYVDDTAYDSDVLSWLYLNIKNCNFIIGKLSDDIEDMSLIAPYARDSNTFLINSLNINLQNWFGVLNPNNTSTILSIILKIKEKWIKNSKCDTFMGRG